MYYHLISQEFISSWSDRQKSHFLNVHRAVTLWAVLPSSAIIIETIPSPVWDTFFQQILWLIVISYLEQRKEKVRWKTPNWPLLSVTDWLTDWLLLQELCLYLDEERAGTVTVCTDCGGPCPPPHPTIQAVRDEGDGSSSSTNNDETETSASNLLEELNAINAREKLYLKGNKMGLNGEQKLFWPQQNNWNFYVIADEILAYIRNLEDRVKLLEAGSEYPLSKHFTIEQITEEQDQGNRPASVTNAMKVLEVHEQILEKSLDSDETSDDLCDGEKALVREMCNVRSLDWPWPYPTLVIIIGRSQ